MLVYGLSEVNIEKLNSSIEALSKKIQNLADTLDELENEVNDLKKVIDTFGKYIENYTSSVKTLSLKIEILSNDLKQFVNILKTGVEEVSTYIENPIFKGIDDPVAKEVLNFIIENMKIGIKAIPLNVITSYLGVSQMEVLDALDYLREKGFEIEIISSEE